MSLLRRIIRHPLRMGGHGHSHTGEARLFGEPVCIYLYNILCSIQK